MTRPPAYATYQVADAYLAGRPDAAKWLASTDTAQKTTVLVLASDAIDRQHLKGYKFDWTQARSFPRVLELTIQIDVPQQVIDACCEEANEMLKMLGTPRLNLQKAGVTSVSFDGTSETFSKGAGLGLLSVVARDMLKYFQLGAV